MKIALLGQFGSGNSGNDGSLEAMIGFLRRSQPTAALLCFCSDPEHVNERFGIDAASVKWPLPTGRLAKILNRLSLHLIRRIAGVHGALRQLRTVDLLIVPGTGILDDFQESPWGWPFKLWCWCLAARMRKVPIAFISIGAGPIEGRLSRRLLMSAAGMAQYRSYRDDGSLAYATALGLDVSGDSRYPDIAFGLPARPAPIGTRTPDTTVGIGVMDYRGWRKKTRHGDHIHREYVSKIVDVIHRLQLKGCHVRLFTGDICDHRTLMDVLERLPAASGQIDVERLVATPTSSLHQIMEEMAQVDAVIVSRYHSLICALKSHCPVSSIGYARKNDELMATFGLSEFCQHIETFDVDVLLRSVGTLLSDSGEIKRRIETGNRDVSAQLRRQEQLISLRFLKSSQAGYSTGGDSQRFPANERERADPTGHSSNMSLGRIVATTSSKQTRNLEQVEAQDEN
ncbi:MAG: polysaccharide pyruvyl transferase family protein [Shinella sp.]|nr:polysaccharide pyruvyl transferase family protein [Shinella sp.]